MAFREVSVVQVKEALRRWMAGEGERRIAQGIGVDRKTVRRYIAAAVELGLARSGSERQLTDELIGQVIEAVRPKRTNGHGESWRALETEEERITAWVKDGLTVVKIGTLLRRCGVEVPHRTLARFAAERCGAGRRKMTVRVDDPPPGTECQVDFGRLGLIPDGARRRVCHALVFTACYSRHCFVWPTFSQRTEDVIGGFEAAWSYFGGIFPVVIPDNMSPIVTKAEHTAPRFTDTFMEYAQARGFAIDAARVRTPTDKPRVERCVPYVRNNFFVGEAFLSLTDCRGRAETWSRDTAGTRVHGTTRLKPIEVFRTEELPLLLPAPHAPFDVPTWSEPKVHRDFHVSVSRALYSVPHHLIGQRIKARADRTTVKLYHRGELVKLHPRKAPGQRSTDPKDYPKGTEIYARRDIDTLKHMATDCGPAVGTYAEAILDTPLPWTKMRQVYRLLGLAKKWGASPVDQACRRALEAEAIDVNLVSRMVERAREDACAKQRPEAVVVQGRFARDPSEFTTAQEAGR